MQWLYRVIGQAGIFLICAQTVVHFRPKESYDKYLKLLLCCCCSCYSLF